MSSGRIATLRSVFKFGIQYDTECRRRQRNTGAAAACILQPPATHVVAAPIRSPARGAQGQGPAQQYYDKDWQVDQGIIAL